MVTKQLYVNVCEAKDELEDKLRDQQADNARAKVQNSCISRHSFCTSGRVTTCLENLENLEMSGNLKHVREMSGIMLTVREMSGKKSCQGKVSLVFSSISFKNSA